MGFGKKKNVYCNPEDIFDDTEDMSGYISTSAYSTGRASSEYAQKKSTGNEFDPFDDSEDEEYDYHRIHRRRVRHLWQPVVAIILVAIAVISFFGIDDTARPGPNKPVAKTDTSARATSAPKPTSRISTDKGNEHNANTPPAQGRQFEYHRTLLNKNEQIVYDTILYGITEMYEEIPSLEISSPDRLFDIFGYVLDDHPELFWLTGSSSYSSNATPNGNTVTFSPKYSISKSERNTKQRFIEQATSAILDELKYASDYDKVKGVYDFLINRTAYDLNYKGTTLYEFFSDKRGVCEGYAKATQYILLKLGIDTIFVSGYTDESDEGHAWNIVKVDGEYYQLDTTWGDPVYDNGEQRKNYNYYLITTEEILIDHRFDRSLYPECTATEKNYYILENRFLTQYDENVIGWFLLDSFSYGTECSFKCSSKSVADYTVTQLIDNDRFWDIMIQQGLVSPEESASMSYSVNNKMNTIWISFIR